MTYDRHAKRRNLHHRIRDRGLFLGLCLHASCAVYEISPPQGSGGTLDGGSAGASQMAAAGTETDGAGRGGTATGDAGTAGVMHLGGTGAGRSGLAGAADGGAADGGAADGGAGGVGGQIWGGTSGHAGGGGSANGGAASGGTASGGSGGTAGSAPVVTDLSRNKAATASSEQTGKEAARGNDGDGATRWCAKVGTLPQWWRVDLGATHSLKEFKISFEYPDRKYSYDVETSADDSTYTLQKRTSGTAALQSGLFPAGVSARYVRITVTSTDSSVSPTWASLFEFVVTGT